VERTGDTGEPCGVPTVKSKGSDVCPLNLRRTVRSSRKESEGLAPLDQFRCEAKVSEDVYQSFMVDIVEEALYVKEEKAGP